MIMWTDRVKWMVCVWTLWYIVNTGATTQQEDGTTTSQRTVGDETMWVQTMKDAPGRATDSFSRSIVDGQTVGLDGREMLISVGQSRGHAIQGQGRSIKARSSPRRDKRTTVQLTGIQIRELVEAQNWCRRREGSSNMEYNTWNSVLAEMAQDWADNCEWKHGNPDYGSRQPYNPVGQNLYVISGGVINVTAASLAWCNEKPQYDYNTGHCSGMCGHYTQMVWAGTKQVGCGAASCPGMSFGDGDQYLVCNYGPAGNYRGQKPYKKGPACSQCESGKSWCNDGLCDETCNGDDPQCECRAACYNCGTYKAETCSCACADGWTSPDCTEVCADQDGRCGANPGWPTSWCDRSYVYDKCWSMCERCVAAPPSEETCTVAGPGAASFTFHRAETILLITQAMILAFSLS